MDLMQIVGLIYGEPCGRVVMYCRGAAFYIVMNTGGRGTR